jgi:hypothetical protein
MNSRQLAYYRDVLDRISHADARLFRKELRKAFRRLLPEEREALKAWYRTQCVCRVPAVRPARAASIQHDQLK